MIFLRNYFSIFLFSYLVLLLTKVIFFIYLNSYFEAFSLSEKLYAVIWGYKFDFAVSAIIAFIVSLFDFHKQSFVYIATFVLMALFVFQISDIFYYYDAARHVGYEVLDSIADAGALIDTALELHSTLTILAFITALLLSVLTFTLLNKIIMPLRWSRYTILKKIFLLLLTVFFIRGMFNPIPLNPWQSNQIGNAKLASIALNGTYNMITAIMASKTHLKAIKLPKSDQEISALYKGYTPYQAKLERPNIVFFFLESWSMVNLSQKTTPFLYEIMNKSISVKAMIANGHRTTEGIFATLSSFQNPLGKSIAKNQLQDFEYESVIELLNNDGYESTFFQGTAKETSGTGSLAQKLGFVHSYGKEDIAKRRFGVNAWGVFDQDLYAFVQEKLEKQKTPFVIGVNGASTHDDKVPKGTKILPFSADEKKNKSLNALHSSDSALRDFVKYIEQKYPNTLFVFFADHCGHVDGSAYENHLIPFGLYHKDLKPELKDVILSQRDIAPSVVDFIYGDYRSHLPNSSGKSLFSDSKFFAEYFQNGILGWIEGDDAIEIDISSGQYKCFKNEGVTQTSVPCKHLHKNLYHNALSFTNISQKLLFEGKTKEFSAFK